MSRSNIPPDHTDLSELRELWNKHRHTCGKPGNMCSCFDALEADMFLRDAMQLFKQYAQPPVVADKELDEIVNRLVNDIKTGVSELTYEDGTTVIVEAKAALLQREQRLVAGAEERGRLEIWGETYGFLHARDRELCDEWEAQLRHNTNTGKGE